MKTVMRGRLTPQGVGLDVLPHLEVVDDHARHARGGAVDAAPEVTWRYKGVTDGSSDQLYRRAERGGCQSWGRGEVRDALVTRAA